MHRINYYLLIRIFSHACKFAINTLIESLKFEVWSLIICETKLLLTAQPLLFVTTVKLILPHATLPVK